MPYPETVNLPFNRDCLKGNFAPVSTGLPEGTGQGFLLLLQGENLILSGGEDSPRLPTAQPPDWIESCSLLTIGRWQNQPLRAGRIPPSRQIPGEYVIEPLSAYSRRLDDQLLTLGGIAKNLLAWDSDSVFCPRCGSSAVLQPGSWCKRCTACRFERFPPAHPCAIVLVRHGREFLLGRKAAWPVGRYSLIAGFLDPGESLEECAVREVREETGVEISNLRYVGSQNWPFPSQLMAGFVADYAGGELTPENDELEDVRWFTPDVTPLKLPSERSIARWIIDRYALQNII